MKRQLWSKIQGIERINRFIKFLYSSDLFWNTVLMIKQTGLYIKRYYKERQISFIWYSEMFLGIAL